MMAKVTGEQRQGHGGQVDADNGDQEQVMPFLQFGQDYNAKFVIVAMGMPTVRSPPKAMPRMQTSHL